MVCVGVPVIRLGMVALNYIKAWPARVIRVS